MLHLVPSINYSGLASELGINGAIAGQELRSRCPIHHERNASFSLNIQTGLWICFSKCGSGDFFRLVELVQSCSPQEARDWIFSNGARTSPEQLLERLGQRLNPTALATPQIANQDWFLQYQSLNASVMPQWFFDRGFTWNTVAKFGIVYNQPMDALVVPVYWNEKFVGTVTRNNWPDLPRYQNSPDLPKEQIFFGEISRDQRDIMLVEGLLDAVWTRDIGYRAHGILGSALTRAQVQVMKAHRIGEVTLAFDNDGAGEEGTRNAVKLLVSEGWLMPQIKVVRFPGDWRRKTPEYRKDPNECTLEEFAVLYGNRRDVLGI